MKPLVMKKIFLLTLLAATPASTPAWAHASVKSPSLIRLVFSESLEPAFSGAALTDAAGKTVPVSRSVGGATITLMPLSLRPGAYKVTWHSVGHDTHRISGSFGFKVIP